jgi:DNA-binding CsgD family transcriptional regulator
MSGEPDDDGRRSGRCDSLSRREVEVLEMTSRGLTNREIAVRLQVTSHAVKFHLSSIFRKLGVRNRTEATSVYQRSVGQ